MASCNLSTRLSPLTGYDGGEADGAADDDLVTEVRALPDILPATQRVETSDPRTVTERLQVSSAFG